MINFNLLAVVKKVLKVYPAKELVRDFPAYIVAAPAALLVIIAALLFIGAALLGIDIKDGSVYIPIAILFFTSGAVFVVTDYIVLIPLSD